MKKTHLILSFLIITLLTTSCGVGGAKERAEEFHKYFQAEDYSSMVDMVCEKTFSTTSEEEWTVIFKNANDKLGKLKTWESGGFHANSNKKGSFVTLDFTLEFEGGTLYEEIIFKKEKGKLNILGYRYAENKSNLSDD